MSDKYHSLLVVLEYNVNEEQEHIIATLLKNIKGVCDVKPNVTNSFEQEVAQSRVKSELRHKIGEILK